MTDDLQTIQVTVLPRDVAEIKTALGALGIKIKDVNIERLAIRDPNLLSAYAVTNGAFKGWRPAVVYRSKITAHVKPELVEETRATIREIATRDTGRRPIEKHVGLDI